MAEDILKRCTLCGVTKALSDFAKRKERRCSHCKACVCARAKKYAADRGADFKAKKKAYDLERTRALKDLLSAQAKARYESKRQEKIAAARIWVERNPERRQAISASYKHRRRTVEKAGISGPELAAWKDAQAKICYWCGCDCSSAPIVDHYQPLAKGGKHEIENLVIACRPCNARKSAKDPLQFAAEIAARA